MVSKAVTVSGVSSVASDITDEMIEAAARALAHTPWHLAPEGLRSVIRDQATRALEAGLAGRTVVEPDWTLVEAAVARGIADHAAAYAIPANQLAGGDREQERRMAESWGKTMAPHVTACIREDLRQAGSVGSETPAGDPS
jgi:malic enzyme